jgi:hypothetical protein
MQYLLLAKGATMGNQLKDLPERMLAGVTAADEKKLAKIGASLIVRVELRGLLRYKTLSAKVTAEPAPRQDIRFCLPMLNRARPSH